ncbi:malonyl-CoA decarboxylase domain-containing protein [Microbacterium album]|uniref:Malonyl-CoA decarboxylase C-terminal domain-containing protein n=1 Tax=Microbacterium album TaxID=2053191 RepID=A0A917IE69_9MICO|nr:malonyl-CoA decarboxylase family protein [Microbacterium album]GGH36782.1 hypothetical protein GCM10010921_06170 [Microbacterium album]
MRDPLPAGGGLTDPVVAAPGAPSSGTIRERLRALAGSADGLATLLRMRRDAIVAARRDAQAQELERELHPVLAALFAPAGLQLVRIDAAAPPALLDHLVRHEAVHPVADRDELLQRLIPSDRRCYGLFHPRLPERPVAFVQIALMAAPPDTIAEILAPERTPLPPESATAAVFYSISAAEDGLRGIPSGGPLIKRALSELAEEFPGLSSFATLSPIPGFRRWLADATGAARPELRDLRDSLERGDAGSAHREALRRAVELYLSSVRPHDGRPLDPVARFHLGNGARLTRVQLDADTSPAGLERSYGAMACYEYERRPT